MAATGVEEQPAPTLSIESLRLLVSGLLCLLVVVYSPAVRPHLDSGLSAPVVGTHGFWCP